MATGAQARTREAHLRLQPPPGAERLLSDGRGARGPRGRERRRPVAGRHVDGADLLGCGKRKLDPRGCGEGVQREREPAAGLVDQSRQTGRPGHGEPALVGTADAGAFRPRSF
jgi:hypothetical protein